MYGFVEFRPRIVAPYSDMLSIMPMASELFCVCAKFYEYWLSSCLFILKKVAFTASAAVLSTVIAAVLVNAQNV